MSSIFTERSNADIADYYSIRTWIIRDRYPRSKRGLSDYYIECFMWHGKMTYTAILDCAWFIDTGKVFNTLREASQYIRRYAYTKTKPA